MTYHLVHLHIFIHSLKKMHFGMYETKGHDVIRKMTIIYENGNNDFVRNR